MRKDKVFQGHTRSERAGKTKRPSPTPPLAPQTNRLGVLGASYRSTPPRNRTEKSQVYRSQDDHIVSKGVAAVRVILDWNRARDVFQTRYPGYNVTNMCSWHSNYRLFVS